MEFLNPTNDKTKNQPRNQKSIHHSTGRETISRGGNSVVLPKERERAEEEEDHLSRAKSVSSCFSSPRREFSPLQGAGTGLVGMKQKDYGGGTAEGEEPRESSSANDRILAVAPNYEFH
ncbi:hypothetical protein NE237_018140 [Protea cynaroides]|uniref:Uncharacterized protein n=1 Tax=Protea cynaroides TaxID=273540 RepID=A0A9Q0K9H1_9MAGN|nr:hypothetical protein NE237_018140 [Protea cynaroides]